MSFYNVSRRKKIIFNLIDIYFLNQTNTKIHINFTVVYHLISESVLTISFELNTKKKKQLSQL